MTIEDKIIAVLGNIKDLHGECTSLIETYRAKIASLENSTDAKGIHGSEHYWKLVAYCDAQVKIRIFIENNFSFIETMGLLALSRYILELSIWIRLLEENEKYGLLYCRMLIKEQLEYYDEQAKQIERELKLISKIIPEEQRRVGRLMQRKGDEIKRKLAQKDMSEFTNIYSKLYSENEQALDLSFAIYSEQARVTGFEYRSHDLITNILPKVVSDRDTLEKELNSFKITSNEKLGELARMKWNWKDLAKKVSMEEEYEFVYSYISRLLHAKPSNLTTNQKNLEKEEVYVLLKHINLKMRDILSSAKRTIHKRSLH